MKSPNTPEHSPGTCLGTYRVGRPRQATHPTAGRIFIGLLQYYRQGDESWHLPKEISHEEEATVRCSHRSHSPDVLASPGEPSPRSAAMPLAAWRYLRHHPNYLLH